MAWTMKELRKDVGGRKYQPPRVRRLNGRGMYEEEWDFWGEGSLLDGGDAGVEGDEEITLILVSIEKLIT
jgi:hypothetical protein